MVRVSRDLLRLVTTVDSSLSFTRSCDRAFNSIVSSRCTSVVATLLQGSYQRHVIRSIASEMFMAILRLTKVGSFETIIPQLPVKIRNFFTMKIITCLIGIKARGDDNPFTIFRPANGFKSAVVDHP